MQLNDDKNHKTEIMANFDRLPEDVLIEILIRLPLKPANRCKCVSKQWLSLMSTCHFRDCYTQYRRIEKNPNHNTPPFVLYYQTIDLVTDVSECAKSCVESRDPVLKSPGFLHRNLITEAGHRVRHLASSNGLVLSVAVPDYDKQYFVCNPMTKQWVALPHPPPTVATTFHIGFMCRPYNDNNHGEERCSSATTFVVVRVVTDKVKEAGGMSCSFKLQTYCSRTGKWTEDTFMPDMRHELLVDLTPSRCISASAVVCNGMLHWVDVIKDCVFAYKPYSSEYRIIELPRELSGDADWHYYSSCFSQCCGNLRYAYQDVEERRLHVWEFDGRQWLLVHELEMQKARGFICIHPFDRNILYICSKSGRVMEFSMLSRALRPWSEGATFLRRRPLRYRFTVFPFVLPCWPTPLPVLHPLS